MATREELTSLKQQLSAAIATGRLKGVAKTDATTQVATIDARLTEGDVVVGDRLLVTVTSEVVQSDTTSVLANRTLALLGLPEVSVAGILRSELTPVVQKHIGRFLRSATVRVVPLIRVRVLGAVMKPGYYIAPPDKPVSELIMLAGGPAPEAKIDQMEITHLGRLLVSAKASKRVIEDGKTLEQLGVVSGDEVTIPKKKHVSWQPIVQFLFLGITAFVTVVQLLKLYYDQQS